MLISTKHGVTAVIPLVKFQSLDWVDVDFDLLLRSLPFAISLCFNPSTGLMLISTRHHQMITQANPCFNPSTGLMLISTGGWRMGAGMGGRFQSLDWVDVDFDAAYLSFAPQPRRFQSLDWVDVDFDLRSPCGDG